VDARPKPAALREAIANSIADNLKSYNVAAFCEAVGLAPQADGEEPFRSKRLYVLAKLQGLGMPQLVEVGLKVLDEWDDDDLQLLVDAVGIRGVQGDMKNLIFASDGPKPQIVSETRSTTSSKSPSSPSIAWCMTAR
jgi:hypothetical protein